jgi:hypothetical protein
MDQLLKRQFALNVCSLFSVISDKAKTGQGIFLCKVPNVLNRRKP